MFIGFIAVVIILLVIVALMATGVFSGADTAEYMTQAKKVHALMSQVEGESKFYYAQNDQSYSGISMDYFLAHDVAKGQMVPSGNMASADWDGWPAAADVPLADPYTGPYIPLGGPAGDQMRIIAVSINNGQSVAFHILKLKANTVDPIYLKILEKALASDPNYIGG
jgi:hypothetical protein